MARILVVEDDESVRSLVVRALRSSGHDIDEACDGAQGLQTIEERAGAYDLVLSDIRMPEMDGIEMAKAAAVRFHGLKIMLVTAYADQRERAEDLDAVVVDVILKPFALADLRQRVGRALAA